MIKHVEWHRKKGKFKAFDWVDFLQPTSKVTHSFLLAYTRSSVTCTSESQIDRWIIDPNRWITIKLTEQNDHFQTLYNTSKC